MGRKSREKRERRLAESAGDPDVLLCQMMSWHDQFGERKQLKDAFLVQVRQTRTLLIQYDASDVALAIGVSELWPANAVTLSDLGFSLADFASQEALQLKLTSSTIRDLAARFHISYDWLAGKTDEVFRSEPGTWYKAMDEAANQLLSAKQSSMRTELSICIPEHADLSITDDNQAEDKLSHFIPVLIRTQQLLGQEVLETYEVWEEGRWSYWRCREHIKLAIYFAQRLGTYVTGRTLTQNEYSLLSRGQVLPATILRRNSRVTWHPDDYVTLNSPVSKEAGEWSAITSNEDYKTAFARFNQLLTQGASI